MSCAKSEEFFLKAKAISLETGRLVPSNITENLHSRKGNTPCILLVSVIFSSPSLLSLRSTAGAGRPVFMMTRLENLSGQSFTTERPVIMGC